MSSSHHSSPEETSQTSDSNIEEGASLLNKGAASKKSRVLVEKDKNKYSLPEDTFTMIFFAKPWSIPWIYGFFVYSCQLTMLGLILYDLVFKYYTDAIEKETENKLQLPVIVDSQVLVAQVFALVIAAVTRDDVMDTFKILAVGYFDEWGRFPGGSLSQFILMNMMRCSEGIIVICVSFIFIVQSQSVLDIFLNFAAVEFISGLDNVAYSLAAEGWIFSSAVELADEISHFKIVLNEEDRKSLQKYAQLKPSLLLLLLGLLGVGWGLIYRMQLKGEILQKTACNQVSVSFGDVVLPLGKSMGNVFEVKKTTGFFYDDEDAINYAKSGSTVSTRPLADNFDLINPPDVHFASFSGNYISSDDEVKHFRPVYYERGFNDITSGKFSYCDTEKAWVFTIEALENATGFPQKTKARCEHGWLARSSKTKAFSLDKVEGGWKIWTGKLEDASAMSISCAECNDDIDCGLEGGTCNINKTCECYNGYAGDFCGEEPPCDPLALYYPAGFSLALGRTFGWNENKEVTIDWRKNESTSTLFYGRPVYQVNADVSLAETQLIEQKDLKEQIEVLLYNGRRWYNAFLSYYDIAMYYRGTENLSPTDRQSHVDQLFHAYWGRVLERAEWFSKPTEQHSPIGQLAWRRVTASRSIGDYGSFGRTVKYDQVYHCLSVDCSVKDICGRGKCKDVANMVLAWVVTPMAGSQCVCDETYSGHYCEFANNVTLDDDSGEIKYIDDKDPYLGACYPFQGPFEIFPDCLDELYEDQLLMLNATDIELLGGRKQKGGGGGT